MAVLTYQAVDINGVNVTLSAAGASGDTLAPNDRGGLLVNNGNASAITVTVVVPGSTKYGLANPDVVSESIPAGGIAVLGPFPHDLADPSDDRVHVTYSATASVQVAAIRL